MLLRPHQLYIHTLKPYITVPAHIQEKLCAVLWCMYCAQIDAFTGDKYYQAVTWQDGKMVPAGWKR
jgi:hypothetical protein